MLYSHYSLEKEQLNFFLKKSQITNDIPDMYVNLYVCTTLQACI